MFLSNRHMPYPNTPCMTMGAKVMAETCSPAARCIVLISADTAAAFCHSPFISSSAFFFCSGAVMGFIWLILPTFSVDSKYSGIRTMRMASAVVRMDPHQGSPL